MTRGKNAAKYYPNGTGLGLYIVKLIAEKAEGEVRVESIPGQGSTFTLRIPG